MTEYWLQKKTLGGWSHVTWYGTEAEAITNMNKACAGDSGYSWRVCRVDVLAEKLLQDHEEPKKPELEHAAAKTNVWAGQSKGGWDVGVVDNGWSDFKSDSEKSEHGMSGKIWLVNHSLKEKKRINPAEVDAMLASGWERGGPKTKFK